GLGEGERRLRVYNRYRNAVHYADSLVGTMLDALVRRGLLDDTIVLVTGDHGEEFNEHGYWGHNGAFTPDQVHVPLVLHLPRSRATPSPRSGAPLARLRQRRAHAGGRDRVSLGGRPGGRARLGLRCGRHGRADRDREPARRPAAARRLAARARLRARWPPGAA